MGCISRFGKLEVSSQDFCAAVLSAVLSLLLGDATLQQRSMTCHRGFKFFLKIGGVINETA